MTLNASARTRAQIGPEEPGELLLGARRLWCTHDQKTSDGAEKLTGTSSAVRIPLWWLMVNAIYRYSSSRSE